MISFNDLFVPVPKVNVITNKEKSITITGSPMNCTIFFMLSFSIFNKGINVDKARKITGNNADIKLLNAPCIESAGILLALNVLMGTVTIFFNVFEYHNPAMITVGMASINPYKSVWPRLALNCATNAVGEGWGGKKPCVTDSEAISGR